MLWIEWADFKRSKSGRHRFIPSFGFFPQFSDLVVSLLFDFDIFLYFRCQFIIVIVVKNALLDKIVLMLLFSEDRGSPLDLV